MSKWDIVVHGYIPRSPNASPRQHWGRRFDERNFWESVVGSAAHLQEIPKATGRRSVTYEICKPGKIKLRDKDNLHASIKHLQDALVNMKLLVDDSPEWIECEVHETNGNKQYSTRITLRDL